MNFMAPVEFCIDICAHYVARWQVYRLRLSCTVQITGNIPSCHWAYNTLQYTLVKQLQCMRTTPAHPPSVSDYHLYTSRACLHHDQLQPQTYDTTIHNIYLISWAAAVEQSYVTVFTFDRCGLYLQLAKALLHRGNHDFCTSLHLAGRKQACSQTSMNAFRTP